MFRKCIAAGAAFACALGLSGVLLGGTASADQGGSLTPDPDAYCVGLAQTLSFQTNQTWQVNDPDVVGDAGSNDWKCSFSVSASVPVAEGGDAWTGEDADENDFAFLIPITYQPIDWSAMCGEQFPGSTAQWVPEPETGVDGAPWQCVGALDTTYGPESASDGTTAATQDSGGW